MKKKIRKNELYLSFRNIFAWKVEWMKKKIWNQEYRTTDLVHLRKVLWQIVYRCWWNVLHWLFRGIHLIDDIRPLFWMVNSTCALGIAETQSILRQSLTDFSAESVRNIDESVFWKRNKRLCFVVVMVYWMFNCMHINWF